MDLHNAVLNSAHEHLVYPMQLVVSYCQENKNHHTFDILWIFPNIEKCSWNDSDTSRKIRKSASDTQARKRGRPSRSRTETSILIKSFDYFVLTPLTPLKSSLFPDERYSACIVKCYHDV